MREIKYRVLSRLGIWVTGIFDENGEQVDWYVQQTWIRRALNRVWFWLNEHGIGEDLEGDMPDFNYLPIKKTW